MGTSDNAPTTRRPLVSSTVLRTLHEERGFVLVDVGNVGCLALGGAASTESAAVLQNLLLRMGKTYPTISILTIASFELVIPDQALRNAFRHVLEATSSLIACSGVVAPSHAFAASTVRGIITDINLAPSTSFPLKVSSNLREVIRWLGPQHAKLTGTHVTEATLLEAANHVLRHPLLT